MCQFEDQLKSHVREVEQRHRAAFEASRDFIHQYASTVHSRAVELQAGGLSKADAFRQAAREKNNIKLKKVKKSD